MLLEKGPSGCGDLFRVYRATLCSYNIEPASSVTFHNMHRCAKESQTRSVNNGNKEWVANTNNWYSWVFDHLQGIEIDPPKSIYWCRGMLQ